MGEHMGYNPDETLRTIKPKHEKAQPKPDLDNDVPDISHSRALSIFENAMINRVNAGLETSDENEIISSNGAANLEWIVDEDTSEGHFAIIQRHGPVERKSGEYIWITDEKTGEKYQEEKLPEEPQPLQDKATTYYLKTEQVKEVFRKLNPDVQKSFIDGLKENMDTLTRGVKMLQSELNDEKDAKARKKLEELITEQELAQEKLKKELQALA
jgi:hypothetical protein